MILSEAIRIAYAQEPFRSVPTQYEVLEKALALAIVATWSAECSDVRRADMAPYYEAEHRARKALDVYLAETFDYLTSYCS